MTSGLWTLLLLVGAAMTIVILSFIGPEHSEKPFWRVIQRMRAVLDRICYLFISALAAGTLLLCAVMAGKGIYESWVTDSFWSTLLITLGIALLLFFCIRSMIREHKSGILCDCTGDCSNCRIQCMTNPNYYGLNQGNSAAEKTEE